MNIAYFLHPKGQVAFLYDDYTFRQGLEKMKHHGYSSIPVLARDGRYVGTVSEGDFLWAIYRREDPRYEEKTRVYEILQGEHRDPVRITASMDELLLKVLTQNYVSIVDDSDSFIGIVTRRDVMRYYYEKIKEIEAQQTSNED